MWIVGSTNGHVEFGRESTRTAFNEPPDWVQWSGVASRIGLNLWLGALVTLGFVWLFRQLRDRD